ncbi:MAG: hypothetical protein M1150_00270 [Patescibacteria group bacterium]|nr:hypothetical protein [Patescibacteria group bacterium]
MDLLVTTSFIAAFFAGVAALFAPCCITVLLPTYFASIFKQKAKVFLMTFIYFLGVLLIFLPLGLGAGGLTQIFSQYHDPIYIFMSFFLIFLGLTMVFGRKISLPMLTHPELKNYDVGSIFILGVFSGIATTCCAPVLAGVLALSAMPGSFFLGGVYTLAYVLGMVVPLFLLAAFLDKTDFTQKFFAFRKMVSYSILGQKVSLTIATLFSGLLFFALGGLTLFLAVTNQLTMRASYQIDLNIYVTKLVKSISGFTTFFPEQVWALVFVGLFLLLTKLAFSQLKKKETKDEN